MENFLFFLLTLSCIRGSPIDFPSFNDYDIRELLRTRRSLLFPDPLKSETKLQVLFGLGLPMEGQVSMTLGYVLKCNYRLPYNSSDFNVGPHVRAGISDPDLSSLPSSSEQIVGGISRWNLYRMLEMLMETGGSSGRACLLRAVCESAEVTFRHGRHGIIGEILHLFLTPSTSRDEYEIYTDREYHAAEIIGRDSSGKACQVAYHECSYSPLNYITRIREF